MEKSWRDSKHNQFEPDRLTLCNGGMRFNWCDNRRHMLGGGQMALR